MPLPIKPKGNGGLSFLGLLLAFALLLSYIEALIPFYFGIPGAKLGLANLAVVLALYLYGAREALLLNVMRIFLGGFLFGNLSMIAYSMAGALCSFFIMLLFRRTRWFSLIAVSMAGSIFHHIGQILLAMWIMDTVFILYYLPFLLAVGLVTGGFTGVTATVVKPYLQRVIRRS